MLRFTKTHLLVLCPLGHLVESFDLREWAGSAMESEVSCYQNGEHNRIARMIENCHGYGHEEVKSNG
jgi:hypothetical protein